MEKSDILYFYGQVVFQCCTILWLIYLVIRKKKVSDQFVGIKLKQWLNVGNNQFRFETAFRCCMLLFAFVTIIISMNYFKDIPHLRSGNFQEIVGVVIGGDHRRNKSTSRRYVGVVEQGTNREYSVSFFDNYVDKGEALTVICLPHTGFGTRIREEQGE